MAAVADQSWSRFFADDELRDVHCELLDGGAVVWGQVDDGRSLTCTYRLALGTEGRQRSTYLGLVSEAEGTYTGYE